MNCKIFHIRSAYGFSCEVGLISFYENIKLRVCKVMSRIMLLHSFLSKQILKNDCESALFNLTLIYF